MSSSPITTRNRAVVVLDTPTSLFDVEANMGVLDGSRLCLRKPLFAVAHISTGDRVQVDSETESGGMYRITVNVWRFEAETNGLPHGSDVLLLPSSWPTNLFLYIVGKSVRENGVVRDYKNTQ
mmetsp:Transcript_13629/g.17757  ORF Transcript_13629/g.17757 Transcript_13629/m.17757 type:complete len:123 (+) Transcript_13629:223-591(+)